MTNCCPCTRAKHTLSLMYTRPVCTYTRILFYSDGINSRNVVHGPFVSVCRYSQSLCVPFTTKLARNRSILSWRYCWKSFQWALVIRQFFYPPSPAPNPSPPLTPSFSLVLSLSFENNSGHICWFILILDYLWRSQHMRIVAFSMKLVVHGHLELAIHSHYRWKWAVIGNCGIISHHNLLVRGRKMGFAECERGKWVF